MDLYEFLKVEKTATQKEIKKAYRLLAKIYHPDKDTGDGEKFKKLAEAYEILHSTELRKDYDSGMDISKIKKESDSILSRVLSVFEEALNSSGFVADHVNIFKTMRSICNEKEQRMDRDKDNLTNEIANLKSVHKRLSNGKTNDVFKVYVDDKIDGIKGQIKEIEQAKENIRKVLSFIADCDYEVDEDTFHDIPPRRFL